MVFLVVIASLGCNDSNEDFDSIELVSSKDERIYINSISWGITGDNQRTIITKDKNKLKDENDTTGIIDGLLPFIYSFKNDTLKLYFNGKVNYNVEEKFKTIVITYTAVANPKYMQLSKLASENIDYHNVPNSHRVKNESIPKPGR